MMDDKKNRLGEDVGRAEGDIGQGARKDVDAGKDAMGNVKRGFNREDKKNQNR